MVRSQLRKVLVDFIVRSSVHTLESSMSVRRLACHFLLSSGYTGCLGMC